jgi:hypothetical protein
MKHSIEYERFTALVDRVIAVPHSVIKQRVEEHRKRSAENPNRPGPKRKTVKPSVSDPEASGH